MHIDFAGLELLPKNQVVKIKNKITKIFSGLDLVSNHVSVGFTDKKNMRDLHKKFKNKNSVTDILSFGVPESEQKFEHVKNFLGDLVICVEQAQIQAENFNHTLCEEIGVLTAHGLLHLLGYDHEENQEQAMIQMQIEMYLLECASISPELSLLGRYE